VIVELINTGSELMLGRVLNTHQQWLGRRLADLGYTVDRQVAVPDRAADIVQVLREALARADLVLVTGGLGPTSDDLTRDLLAQLLGRQLREDPGVVSHIEEIFRTRQRPMPAATRVQAMVLEGATVLPNPHGTAPGLAIQVQPNPFRESGQESWLVLLPGPPRELRPMFVESVVPLLARVAPRSEPFACRTLRAIGIGESIAQQRIEKPLEAMVAAGLEVGYCARMGQVDVRLSARGAGAEERVGQAVSIVGERLGAHVFGFEDEELEAVVLRLLESRRETLALAESCTGGCLAHRLTNIPGASAVLLGGLVTYSNEAKQRLLGVRPETLEVHGAVSEAVAREMAEGARKQLQASYALSITGIAGPSGGTKAKPGGTVYIGMAGPFPTVVERQFNPVDRETFKQVTAQQALNLLRLRLTAK
jgi:nicotinamide-nucleotide amidase